MAVRDPDPKSVLPWLQGKLGDRHGPVVDLAIKGGFLVEPLHAAGPPLSTPFDFHPGVLGTQVGRGIDSRRQVGKRPALDRSYGYLADPGGAQISHRDHVTQPGCPPDVAQPKLNSVVGLLGGDPGRESSSCVVEDGNLRYFGPVEQDRGLEGLLILPELETSGKTDQRRLAGGPVVDHPLGWFNEIDLGERRLVADRQQQDARVAISDPGLETDRPGFGIGEEFDLFLKIEDRGLTWMKIIQASLWSCTIIDSPLAQSGFPFDPAVDPDTRHFDQKVARLIGLGDPRGGRSVPTQS